MKRISIFLIILLVSTIFLVSGCRATPEPPAEPPSVEPPVAPTEEPTEPPVTPEASTPEPTPPPKIEVKWESNGPEKSESISTIFITDKEGNIIIATEYGNIWRSEDAGKSWLNVSEGTACQTPITRDPNDPNTMYVGTRNRATVYKSIDSGKTWKPTPTTGLSRTSEDLFQGISGLVVDSKGRIWVTLNGKVFKSGDGGETWSEITNLPSFQWKWKIVQVHVEELDTPEKLRAFRESAGSAAVFEDINCVYNETIYESRDGGQTWTKIEESMRSSDSYWDKETNFYEYEKGMDGNIVRGVDPESGWVYVKVIAPIYYLYKTLDGGKSWEECPLNEWASALGIADITWEAKKDPNNENIILEPKWLGPDDWEFRLSFDGGDSWSKINLPPGWEPKGNVILTAKNRFDLISSKGTLKLFLGTKRVWQASISLPE